MINSLLKAIDIISLFSPRQSRLSLTEISRRLDIPKSTAHNLLNTLLSRGFIEKTDNDRYALGTAIIVLTQSVRVNVELRDRAAASLRSLADVCHESVYLAVRDADRCLYIHAIESPHRLLARTAVGDHAPLHCTAVGKAILAWLPQQEADRIIEQVGLPAYTEATITSPQALRAELEQTRQRGFAVNRGEHEPDTYCIGAPILNDRAAVIGACSISGSDPEIVQRRLPELSARVVNTAHEISSCMGYVAARPGLIAQTVMPPSLGTYL